MRGEWSPRTWRIGARGDAGYNGLNQGPANQTPPMNASACQTRPVGPAARRVLPALILLAMESTATAGTAADPGVTYEGDVRSVLERCCVDCHGWWFPKGGLRLDSRAAVRRGGRSGPAVVPGSPDMGWLMHTLRLDNSGRLKMPPGDERLSDEAVQVIRRRIEQGTN